MVWWLQSGEYHQDEHESERKNLSYPAGSRFCLLCSWLGCCLHGEGGKNPELCLSLTCGSCLPSVGGNTIESAFGVRNKGKACLELNGLIQLASLWDWIRAHQASWYFCGLEYAWVVIVLLHPLSLFCSIHLLGGCLVISVPCNTIVVVISASCTTRMDIIDMRVVVISVSCITRMGIIYTLYYKAGGNICTL